MRSNMEKHCPFCDSRVSDWWVSSGKTTAIGKFTVHNSCLQDFELRRGSVTLAEVIEELQAQGG